MDRKEAEDFLKLLDYGKDATAYALDEYYYESKQRDLELEDSLLVKWWLRAMAEAFVAGAKYPNYADL